jgi:1,4-dihydroxy-2-naphthoyl-CoA hydrolase
MGGCDWRQTLPSPSLAPGRFAAPLLLTVPFTYQRTIHFPDTDAAGVVFFANYLAICHEAYEESLAAAGIGLRDFFSMSDVVVPVSKNTADYVRPLYCGDKVVVTVKPVSLTADTYAVDYEIEKLGTTRKLAANVRTWHVCITTKTRERAPLPPVLARWVSAG